MRKSDKIERYLRHLERELEGLPESARTKIMSDTKAQIERGVADGLSPGAVLRELGSPRLIAMSHIKRRPCEDESHSVWLRRAAVATVLASGSVFAYGIHWIRQHAALRRERALASASVVTRAQSERNLDSRNLREFRVNRVLISFATGHISLSTSADETMSWSCEGSPRVEILDHALTLNMESLNVAHCTVAIPADVATKVRGAGGHLELIKPRGAFDVGLVNGRVNVSADPELTYDYDVRVKNGLQDFFRAVAKPGAIKIKVAVTNGTVKKE